MTDRYAVIGNPVAHSKSPRIHAAFAGQTGETIVYDALHAELDAFEARVQAFRDAGGCGLNVTVPFKHRAYALAQRRAPRAEQALAVNTLRFDDAGVFGAMTDGIGLVRDLTQNIGCAIAGTRVLLVGAGGAAYGVCGALLEAEPAALVVVNRTPEKARSLVEHFSGLFPAADLTAAAYGAPADSAFDLVINATSAGLAGAMPALARGVFNAGALAYDMMYGQTTPFLEVARDAGARTADGIGMLVEQAAESFYIWRGVRPETTSVIASLRSEP